MSTGMPWMSNKRGRDSARLAWPCFMGSSALLLRNRMELHQAGASVDIPQQGQEHTGLLSLVKGCILVLKHIPNVTI